MFYVNNKQVKGIFLNGRNYNYLVYGFGKIIPEDRTAEQLNLNLAGKYLNKYRIEFGTVKDGYENALVSPRFDKPDSNGVFHTPFTYYYGGNIISTKEVNVLINNAHWALLNASVYNDMNINGNITYFATNTDFLGHNVNVFPEGENEPIYKARLNQPILSNCTNFSFDIQTRFSKRDGYPSVGDCNNFSGNFRYVGNSDGNYPGFRGFLYQCRDGVFNINCTNMHGGGSDANVTNYYNFSCISNSNNIKLNINGSPWQAWVHPNCYSSNCNIDTWYIVPGFDHMRDCNFKFYIPRYADVEKSGLYSILSNSYNCNVYFDGLNSNLYSFRNGEWGSFLFENLNNCNLNLLLNNSNGLDYALGRHLNNCNIYFDNMNFKPMVAHCWGNMNNCNITGNVINAEHSGIDLVAYSTNVGINVNASSTNNFSLLWNSGNISGDAILGKEAIMQHSNNLILNLYNGNNLRIHNVWDSKFRLDNTNNVDINEAYNTNFNLYNAVGSSKLSHLDNVKFVERGGANYTIPGINYCNNSWIYANTLDGLIENVYNTRIESKNNNPYFYTRGVNKCEITGFPTSAAYTTNCRFNASLPVIAFRNSSYLTWDNVWPHAIPRGGDGFNTWYMTKAGLRSVDNFSGCYLNCNDGIFGGSVTFDNSNNMQTDIKKFYNGIVTANLPIYNMEIKLNVDCATLNLGIIQAGPPHGFQNATISANNIYATGSMPSACVYLNSDVKLYCENYCNTAFYFSGFRDYDIEGLQTVMLINNYQHSNNISCRFYGGLTRIGRLNYQGGRPADLTLEAGACVFINNALLGSTKVTQNSILFLGSNITWANGSNVTNGGLILGKQNWSSHASEVWSRMDRGHLCWNVWDSGPWGSQSLFDFCINV